MADSRRTVRSIMDFLSKGNIINPATMSPLDVLVRLVPGALSMYHLYTVARKPAVCVSLVCCKESFLYSYPSTGYKHKRVSVLFHSQEWERVVAFTCTVFKQPVLAAQLSKDIIQISTKSISGALLIYVIIVLRLY